MIIMGKKSVILILSFVFFIAVCCCQRNQGITTEQLLEQKEKVAHQLAVDSFVTALNMLDSLYFVCPHDPQIPFLKGVAKTAMQRLDEAKVEFRLSAHTTGVFSQCSFLRCCHAPERAKGSRTNVRASHTL